MAAGDLLSPDAAGVRTTRVFLSTAHIDHDPGNNRMRDLKAFCQGVPHAT